MYEQITGLQALQTGLATEFRCQTTPFKRLVMGKKQPGRPGRATGTKSRRSVEEVAEMEGATPAKRAKAAMKATPKLKITPKPKATPQPKATSKPKSPRGGGRGKGKRIK